MINKGDTCCLLLNYKLNGSPLVQNAYQEIELQINPQSSFNSIKKLLSDGGIVWGTISYIDYKDIERSFTGYYAKLSQEDTFKISSGQNRDNLSAVQLRVMLNDEVGSSAISKIDLGQALSTKVLNATVD